MFTPAPKAFAAWSLPQYSPVSFAGTTHWKYEPVTGVPVALVQVESARSTLRVGVIAEPVTFALIATESPGRMSGWVGRANVAFGASSVTSKTFAGKLICSTSVGSRLYTKVYVARPPAVSFTNTVVLYGP